MDLQEIKDYFEVQLKNWDLARNNVDALNNVKRKPFVINDFKGYVQYNSARAVSTLAKTDKNSILERKCFLCSSNRPKEQKGIEIIQDWDLLVNPFPILPYHFTIVNKHHIVQKFDPEVGFALADKCDDMVVFYNDDGAGASAPDHMHFQAAPITEVPLISSIEENKKKKLETLDLPFRISENPNDNILLTNPINAFFWKSKDGEIHFLGIPRKAHRPNYYYKETPLRRAVSPGALDMAGVLVTPYEEDFNNISDDEIKDIYSQVGFTDEV